MNGTEARARELGIQPDYEGTGGARHKAPADTLRKLVAALGPGPVMPAQTLKTPDGVRCHLPDMPPAWGVAVQLYQIRSGRNWGIGDFADLEFLATVLGAEGADFIALNPLHALFLSDPGRCSPFSPSNRRFLNPLYIAVERVEGFAPGMTDPDRIARLRAADLIDYQDVAEVKLGALRTAWRASGMPDASDAFRSQGGRDLDRHALFESVSARMAADGHGAGWRQWPAEWQDADGPRVAAFAREHAADLAFHRWLQDQADRQLGRVQDACAAAGMAIGLYLDVAVGEAADGSGSWGRGEVLSGVRIGAPPDCFSETGQDWGLAPLSPAALAATQAAPFAALMQCVMRRAGAVRIDHALGLWQLFLIPEGAGPAAGAYARYPLDDMLRALADASNRHRTIVVGEDLGNVPPGFREMMAAAGILSYRILFFERAGIAFIPPPDYPRDALACLSTHDLPTFQGWWQGDDVRLRTRSGLIGEASGHEQQQARPRERQALVRALSEAGLLTGDGDPAADGVAPPEVLVAVHRYLARTPSRLMAVRLEDLAGETRPVNLPGTEDEYPNWRPKLGLTLDAIVRGRTFRQIVGGIRTERPRARPPSDAGDRPRLRE